MAAYPRFLGGSFESQSPLADQQRTVNFYPEIQQAPGEQGHIVLYPTPGVEVFAPSTGSQGRAHFAFDGRDFAVISGSFKEVFANGTTTTLGSVAVDASPATICTNGDGGGQLFITSGDHGYIHDLVTGAFTEVRTNATTMGASIDGYFLALDAATSTLYISDLLDGLTWDPTQFAQRSIQPDPWISLAILDRYVWLLGTETSEVWYNAGTFPFPFAPHPSGLVQFGCAAAFAPKVVAGTLCWPAQTKDGTGQVVQSAGFSPEVISTIPLTIALNGYSTLADAIGDTYADLGHTFYILSVPSARATHVYDTATKLWHERGTWIAEDMQYESWRPLHHAFAFGAHLMLDRALGVVYRLSSTIAIDVENRPLRRMRRAPMISHQARVFLSSFTLHLEAGLGLTSGQGSNPQVAFRYSKDGGKTWSSEHWRSAGRKGWYSVRVKWNRLGIAALPVIEVVMSDPIPWRLTGATLTQRAGERQAA